MNNLISIYTEIVESVEAARLLARQAPNTFCYLPPSNSRKKIGVPICLCET